MNKKIVFLDIDGTILGSDGKIPETAKKAIHQAIENGHELFICSGRSRYQIYDELMELGFTGVVGGAGAYVDYKGKELYHHYMTEEKAQWLVNFFRKKNVGFTIQTDTCGVTDEYGKEKMIERFHRFGFPEIQIQKVAGMLEVIEEPGTCNNPEKMIYIDAPMTVAQMAKEIAPNFDVTAMSIGTVEGKTSCGEIGLAGISKATGMEYLLKHLGYERKDCISFGDGPNDHEMIEYAGVGVAMGNAKDELKALADMVTDHVDEDGLYNGFLKLGLIG